MSRFCIKVIGVHVLNVKGLLRRTEDIYFKLFLFAHFFHKKCNPLDHNLICLFILEHMIVFLYFSVFCLNHDTQFFLVTLLLVSFAVQNFSTCTIFTFLYCMLA